MAKYPSRSTMIKASISGMLGEAKAIFEERILQPVDDDRKYYEEQLRKTPNEDDFGEIVNLESTLTKLSNLYCVEVWRIVEFYLKREGKRLNSKLTTKDGLKKTSAIYEKAGINLESLERFKEIDILHLINNCVKHNASMVSEDLNSVDSEKFKIEVEGKKQEIQMKPDEIVAYIKDAELFLHALVDKMETLGKYY